VLLEHITSLDRAKRIVAEKRYRPTYDSPLAGDSGLNAHILGDKNRAQGICYERQGAKLILEWNGPTTTLNRYPLPVDTLLDERPFRVMVSQGTTKYLRAIRIECDDEVLLAGRSVPAWCFTPKMKVTWRKFVISAERVKLERLFNPPSQIVVLP